MRIRFPIIGERDKTQAVFNSVPKQIRFFFSNPAEMRRLYVGERDMNEPKFKCIAVFNDSSLIYTYCSLIQAVKKRALLERSTKKKEGYFQARKVLYVDKEVDKSVTDE